MVKTKASRDTTPAPIVRFTPEQRAAYLEHEVQSAVGMSVAEFRRAFAAGELDSGDMDVFSVTGLLGIGVKREQLHAPAQPDASAPAQPDASAPATQRDRLRELRSELIAEGAEPGRHLPELERRASTWPASPGHRRDFLLDTGAVFSLSSNPSLLIDYIDLLERFDGSFLIPLVVLGEVITGEPSRDVPIGRLLDVVTGGEDGYVPLTDEIAKRAGALLHQVRESNAPIAGVDAPIDAMVAATAEDLSADTAVTILTTDPEEIGAMVGVTVRTNIAVDVPG
jgi:predicted nucleic acid-binding protein